MGQVTEAIRILDDLIYSQGQITDACPVSEQSSIGLGHRDGFHMRGPSGASTLLDVELWPCTSLPTLGMALGTCM